MGRTQFGKEDMSCEQRIVLDTWSNSNDSDVSHAAWPPNPCPSLQLEGFLGTHAKGKRVEWHGIKAQSVFELQTA